MKTQIMHEGRLKGRNIITHNFFYMNEADSFIHAICKETKRNVYPFWGLTMMLPMNVIMDSNGKILYSDTLTELSGFKMDTVADRKYVLTLKNALKDLK